jgi:hypothetical protein
MTKDFTERFSLHFTKCDPIKKQNRNTAGKKKYCHKSGNAIQSPSYII